MSHLIQKMRDNGIRRLPLIEAYNTLCGLVSFDELLGFLGREISQLSEVSTRSISNEMAHPANMNRRRTVLVASN